jgi:hypothetical protein
MAQFQNGFHGGDGLFETEAIHARADRSITFFVFSPLPDNVFWRLPSRIKSFSCFQTPEIA